MKRKTKRKKNIFSMAAKKTQKKKLKTEKNNNIISFFEMNSHHICFAIALFPLICAFEE